MTTEVEVEGYHLETIDINIIPDQYVVWIVDIWKGSRHDPAVEVVRYIGVWDADKLEDEEGNARDPDFSQLSKPDRSYNWEREIRPAPRLWDKLDLTKKADDDARQFKGNVEAIYSESTYRYGSSREREGLYKEFMAAVDVLGNQPDNEEAWETVARWRQYNAERHER
jgi:hypothetical protein